jgi:hypothetical protein
MCLNFQSDPRCFVEYSLHFLCYDGPRFISYSPRDSEYLNGDMVVHQPERTRFIMRYDVGSMPLDNICTCTEVFVDQKSQFWREAQEPERSCLVFLRGASRRRHCSPCSVEGAESYRWRDLRRWREKKGFGAVVETLIEVCRWLLSVNVESAHNHGSLLGNHTTTTIHQKSQRLSRNIQYQLYLNWAIEILPELSFLPPL